MTRLVRNAYVTAQRKNDGPVKFWVQVPEDGLMLDIDIGPEQIDMITSCVQLESFGHLPGFERRDFRADVSLNKEQWRSYKRALRSRRD